ncbi:hypothetical protein GGQ64_003626 [Rhizobium azooxidifex]|uniref:Uncharacterized protein n=2 Tax=Mycoplana azooxidifex TaxID=1636188 RepID=A0A7W6GKJ9_9HYPH|nr:hypothetical protein [Mycoplana azooxidifex]
MSERIALKRPEGAAAMWMGTFHAFGLDLIRRFNTEFLRRQGQSAGRSGSGLSHRSGRTLVWVADRAGTSPHRCSGDQCRYPCCASGLRPARARRGRARCTGPRGHLSDQ